jgi:hypothetical protein
VGTLIFIGAIIHTFLASKFMLIAHRLEHEYHALKEQEKDTSDDKELSRRGSQRQNCCSGSIVPTGIMGAAFVLLR